MAGCSPTGRLAGFETTRVEIGSVDLTVAVAATNEQRRQGLSDIETLPTGVEGMLFVFIDPRSATFGMRDTLIPLDIWWFDVEGRLLGSTEMQPCPEEPCLSYSSPGDIGWALETPLGAVELAPGDDLEIIAQP